MALKTAKAGPRVPTRWQSPRRMAAAQARKIAKTAPIRRSMPFCSARGLPIPNHERIRIPKLNARARRW